ncbi:hypothetical protein NC99_46590 [Sunxiuqinia dokdonensis]|uniref:Uncharacterized protein n=1 Tax=Sunxiuqinia dokdonensis TaxID=1409788 RepID=A0A0L8V2M9_9BACT|nr:hypothetical protein NC99_46590 [Sunxiuqinia dokdonensis]
MILRMFFSSDFRSFTTKKYCIKAVILIINFYFWLWLIETVSRQNGRVVS